VVWAETTPTQPTSATISSVAIHRVMAETLLFQSVSFGPAGSRE
jgi:hypothetical protein